MKLDKNFFNQNAELVARQLLGKILCKKQKNKILKAKIVETEAYFDNKDPASRACQNGDLRQTMLDKPGTLLVYGVHSNWLINFVTNKKGKAEAVLIRALEPLNFHENTKGPGLLTKALNINKAHHKQHVENSEIWIENPKQIQKFQIQEAKRIGIKQDLPKNLRFYIKENSYISRK